MFITPHTDTGVYTSSRYSLVKTKMLDKYKDNVRELKTEEEVMEAYRDEQCKEIYVLSDMNANGSRSSLLIQLESGGFPRRQSPKVTWVVFEEKDCINNQRLELSHVNVIYHEGDPNDLNIVEQLMMKIDLPSVQQSSSQHRYHPAPEASGNDREAVDYSSYQGVSPIREESPTPPIGNFDHRPENPRATVSQPVKATPPLASDSKPQDSSLERITLLLEEQLKLDKVKYQVDKEHKARMEDWAKKSTDLAKQHVSLLGGALVDTGLPKGPQGVSEDPSSDKESPP